MWIWTHLGIIFVLSLLVCLCGFKKYVYFMSIGYGFSVAVIGAAMAVMSLIGIYPAAGLAHYLQFALFVIYGFRLSGFLLIRELKNAAYRKTLAEATGDESKMPIFVKVVMWLTMGVLYTAQTSGVAFRLFNGAESTICQWIGIAISLFGIILEAIADQQKSAQKAKRPDMVATEQLYKIVRCPNYFGEILFWTGVTVSSLDILQGIGQWITVIIAYILIVFIMFNGAQRLEKRQMKRYGNNAEYKAYADKTPIIIPLLPIYHLNKQD
jgi:steroid 5-alpha reductase family enzyme